MLTNLRRRNSKGQSMLVLVVFLIVFFVLLLGMVAFEFGRYSLCCQQFQHCVDIAALGGATGLASAQTINQAVAQTAAMNTARWIMEQNYVMDKSLNGMVTFNANSGSPPTPGVANRANINFTWLDPETGLPTGVAGDQKIFSLQGAYAYPPLVGSWIGLGPSALLRASANGNGGGTMLDVVLCFDLSGSIDDSTKTTFVDRYRNGIGGPNTYRIVRNVGTLYANLGCTSDTGTGINCCYPQTLGNDNNARYGGVARRGPTQNTPPPGTGMGGVDVRTYTDIVVNLDENDVFAGYTSNLHGTSFSFPNVPCLVEASRGNLESTTIANNANVNLAALGGITPQAGYYREYWEQALQHRHPLYDAQSSAANFFQILNNSCNAHFSLVGFATDENTVSNQNAIAGSQNHSIASPAPGPIPVGSQVPCRIPYVALNKTAGAAGSNFSSISAWFPPTNPPGAPQLTAYGSTDINGALYMALQQFYPPAKIPGGLNNMRVGATPAVVMFTDGRPTTSSAPGDWDGVNTTNTYAIPNGVKIYCIGLAQIPSIVTPMTNVLQPMANNTGGKLYIIPPGTGQAAALDRAFSDIARSLVTLTR